MALTFTVSNLRGYSLGNQRARTALVTVSGTASSGGDALSASALGLATINALQIGNSTTTTGTAGYILSWVKSTGKIHVFRPTAASTNSGHIEVTAGETVTDTFEVFAMGV